MTIQEQILIRESRPLNQRYIGMTDRKCIQDRINRLREWEESRVLNPYQKKRCQTEILRLEKKKVEMDKLSEEKRNGAKEPETLLIDIEKCSPMDQGIAIQAHRGLHERRITDEQFRTIINKLI